MSEEIRRETMKWKRVLLKDVITYKKGKLPSNLVTENSSDKLPYVDIQAFEKKVFRRFGSYDDGVICNDDDVLVVWDGSRSGLVGMGVRGLVGSTIAVFTCKESIIPEFLYYFLKSKYEYINKNPKGDRIPHVNPNIIFNLLIPLPSISEQKKIVKKISIIFKEIRKKYQLIKFSEKNEFENILKNSIQHILETAIKGKYTSNWRKNNPTESSLEFLNTIQKTRDKKFEIIGVNKNMKSWTDVRLENLISIEGRIGWKGLKRDEYVTDGPMFLSVHSLNYGDIVDYRHVQHIPQWRYDESPGLKLQNNDILLTKDGAGIGKIGIVSNLKSPATVNSSILVIRSKEAFNPKFLFYFLKGPKIQKIVKQRISGDRIPHLFQRDIKNFILSVPPIKEQEEIVKIIEVKLEKIKKLKNQIQSISDLGEKQKKLLNSLSHSNFISTFENKLVQ